MKLNVNNTTAIGKPCIVRDADGVEIEGCISCDTETGEVLRYGIEDGDYVVDDTGDDLVRIQETRPAPLQVEWE